MATLKVTFDLNPGPFYGTPIAPEGWLITGKWAINPADGTYFDISDVAADGTVTLEVPPNGWQMSPTGQTVTGFAAGAKTAVPATPALAVAAAAATAANLPLTVQPAIGNLVPTAADVAKYGIFAMATVPAGSPGAAS